jgi:8-oxo-dGTP pyrophosphatase MutT (NUDIX family)
MRCMEGFGDLVQRLRGRLRASVADIFPAGLQPGAVLVPLVEGPGGWSLVLTRRTEGLRSHRGEIAFPGGRVDLGEHPREAALREAREELGILSEEVEILGPLPPVTTNASRFVISPWVSVVSTAVFVPSPAEIAEVIEVPLGRLSAPSARREQRFIRAGFIFISPAYDVGAHTIWGATARIIGHLLDLIE